MSAIRFWAVQNRAISAKAKLLLAVSLSLLVLSGSVQSQQSETTVLVDARKMQELLDRVADLEASQKQLRERVVQLEKAQSGVSTSNASKADPTAATASAGGAALTDASPHEAEPGKTAPLATQQEDQSGGMGEPEHMDVSRTTLNIRGFGDFGFYGGTQKGQTTSFSLGQTNLFITSNLSERFRVLTEMVFEVQQNNVFQTNLERVLLEGSFSDYLKLSVGRYSTAIGYYNTAYHRAAWFQTATERPYIFEYEDEGGILPIHMVGVQASGRIPSGKLGLHYVAEIGNGRSFNPTVEPVQNYVDENGQKAVNLALFARPDRVSGLQTGVSVYRDVLSVAGFPKVTETITDAYALLTRPRFEWLNEALMIRHSARGGHDYVTPAFYSQISERFGQYRPYFQYQYVNASSQEPVFPRVGLRTGPSLGVRFDATESVAFKLQYDHTTLRREGAIDGKTCVQRSMCAPSAAGMQVDFKF